ASSKRSIMDSKGLSSLNSLASSTKGLGIDILRVWGFNLACRRNAPGCRLNKANHSLIGDYSQPPLRWQRNAGGCAKRRHAIQFPFTLRFGTGRVFDRD